MSGLTTKLCLSCTENLDGYQHVVMPHPDSIFVSVVLARVLDASLADLYEDDLRPIYGMVYDECWWYTMGVDNDIATLVKDLRRMVAERLVGEHGDAAHTVAAMGCRKGPVAAAVPDALASIFKIQIVVHSRSATDYILQPRECDGPLRTLHLYKETIDDADVHHYNLLVPNHLWRGLIDGNDANDRFIRHVFKNALLKMSLQSSGVYRLHFNVPVSRFIRNDMQRMKRAIDNVPRVLQATEPQELRSLGVVHRATFAVEQRCTGLFTELFFVENPRTPMNGQTLDMIANCMSHGQQPSVRIHILHPNELVSYFLDKRGGHDFWDMYANDMFEEYKRALQFSTFHTTLPHAVIVELKSG